MEFNKSQIARLVLGYLKKENCISAFQEFFKSSKHLRCHSPLKNRKYLTTRVGGKSLEDLLMEYALIYTIVQSKLEDTNYFNEKHSKESLDNQLLFLLERDNGNVLPSGASTPCHKSPSDEFGKMSDTDQNRELSTSPTESLPGTTCDEGTPFKYASSGNVRHSNEQYDVGDNIGGGLSSQLLSQTLLENIGFPEKLAETINNTIRGSSDVMPNMNIDCITEGASQELSSTIKAIIDQTERDPMFDKVLEDLIGTRAESSVSNKEVTDNRSISPSKLNQSTKSTSDATPPTIRVTEEKNPDPVGTLNSNSEKYDTTPKKNPGGVTVYDGSFDSFIKSTAVAHQPQNQIVLHTTGNLFLVPPTLPSLHYEPPKYYILNSAPSIANISSAPEPQLMTNSALTEQDILKMPTVIINDKSSVRSKVSSSQPVHKRRRKPLVLKPKTPTRKICDPVVENIGEFVTLYKDESEVTENKTEPKVGTQKESRTTSAKVKQQVEFNIEQQNELYIQRQNELKIRLENELNIKQVTEINIKEQNELKIEHQNELEENKPKTPPNKVEKIPTPKSGSHIRNLRFSTPPKRRSTKKVTENSNLKCKKINKKNAIKKLFKDKEGNQKTEKNEGKFRTKESYSWDTELRALACASDTVESTLAYKSKQENAESLEEQKELLHGARMLEAALKTPVKSHTHSRNVLPSQVLHSEEDKYNLTEERESKEDDDTINNVVDMEVESVTTEQTYNNLAMFSLRNCNAGPKFKRKCNIDNPTSVHKMETVALNQLKNERMNVDLVQSPSKFMNSDKILVNTKNEVQSQKMLFSLETPLKDFDSIPNTPRLATPNVTTTLTPFSTQVLEEHLYGVDLNSLETPKLPLTPGFPMTPGAVSTFSNRPTDYSTSSSYYQPSDNEQNNKSLEQLMIEECNRLEKKTEKTENQDFDLSDTVCKEHKPDLMENKKSKGFVATNLREIQNKFNQGIIGKKNLSLIKPNEEIRSKSSDDSTTDESVTEWEDFNQRSQKQNRSAEKIVVGSTSAYSLRKRYTVPSYTEKSETSSLVDKNVEQDDESEENTNKSKKSIFEEIEKKRKRTVMALKQQEKTEIRVGKRSSRSRSGTNKKTRMVQKKKENLVNKKISKEKEALVKTNDIAENEATDEDFVLHLSTDDESFKTSVNDEVQLSFEDSDLHDQSKNVRETKSIENESTKKKVSTRKNSADAVIKALSPKTYSSQAQKLKTDSIGSLCDTKDKLSNCKEGETKMPLSAKIIEDIKKLDKDEKETTSDLEAEELVQGLKERGIHLMHNKSTKKSKNLLNTSNSSINSTSVNDGGDEDLKSINLEDSIKELSGLSQLDVTFDVQVFESEHFSFTYDKKSKKKLENYDLKLVEKELKANVYIECLDREMERIIKCSSFEMLLDVSSCKKNINEIKKKSNIIETSPSKKSSDFRNKPKINKDTSHTDTDKMIYSKEKEIAKKGHTRSKQSTSRGKREAGYNSSAPDCGKRKVDVEKTKVERVPKVDVYKSLGTPLRSDDDGLMDFAILGNKIDGENVNCDKTQIKSTNKRKADFVGENNDNKKQKTEVDVQLLKKIDVDIFLNKLYGSS